MSELIHIDSHVHPCKHVGLRTAALRDTLRAAHHEPWTHRSLQLLLLSEGVDESTTRLLLLLLLLLRETLVVEGVESLVLVGHHRLVSLKWLLEPWILLVQAH